MMLIILLHFILVPLMYTADHKITLPSSSVLNTLINPQNGNQFLNNIARKLGGKTLTEDEIFNHTLDALKQDFPNTKQIGKCLEGITFVARNTSNHIINAVKASNNN